MNGKDVDDLIDVQVYTTSKDTPRWDIDTEVTFDKGETKSGKTRLYAVQDKEQAERRSNERSGSTGSSTPKYTSSYNDPASIKRSAMSMAGKIAIDFAITQEFEEPVPKDQLLAVKVGIRDWLLKEGGKTRDVVIARYHCLEQALECRYLGYDVSDSKKISCIS